MARPPAVGLKASASNSIRAPPRVGWRGCAASCARPLLQVPKLRCLRRRTGVARAGCPGLAAIATVSNPASKLAGALRAALRQLYQHLTNRSQASCFAVCFLRHFVDNLGFFFSILFQKTAQLSLNTYCSTFSRFLRLQNIAVWILQLIHAAKLSLSDASIDLSLQHCHQGCWQPSHIKSPQVVTARCLLP